MGADFPISSKRIKNALFHPKNDGFKVNFPLNLWVQIHSLRKSVGAVLTRALQIQDKILSVNLLDQYVFLIHHND